MTSLENVNEPKDVRRKDTWWKLRYIQSKKQLKVTRRSRKMEKTVARHSRSWNSRQDCCAAILSSFLLRFVTFRCFLHCRFLDLSVLTYVPAPSFTITTTPSSRHDYYSLIPQDLGD
jgi:hypothetical protein